ncbi:unnamed protein product, partial [Pylaiella littoralis]
PEQHLQPLVLVHGILHVGARVLADISHKIQGVLRRGILASPHGIDDVPDLYKNASANKEHSWRTSNSSNRTRLPFTTKAVAVNSNLIQSAQGYSISPFVSTAHRARLE